MMTIAAAVAAGTTKDVDTRCWTSQIPSPLEDDVEGHEDEVEETGSEEELFPDDLADDNGPSADGVDAVLSVAGELGLLPEEGEGDAEGSDVRVGGGGGGGAGERVDADDSRRDQACDVSLEREWVHGGSNGGGRLVRVTAGGVGDAETA